MSLIKFNNRNRLFPWNNDNLKSFLNSENFFDNDFLDDESLMPAMNVKEHDKDFEIEFAAPGFNKKDFDVTIDGDVLNVCAEKNTKQEEKEENYTRKEFSYSSFKRSLQLPKTVNTEEKVKATYDDGILKLNILKKEAEKGGAKKKIEIL
ncbi:Hsp20/alpha crystallin family protein [Lacinutrix sp. C3R15]|uniref:Hsp20/alpha crystallin family protein n=1 Tax=Flavobacteriaceae TaxID=49546 RepID=UPI001C099571|nr:MULTISPECIES: Hsp20/alpha crystallin family protein [Flavobacteriaceae]MBU2939764.1 Hsp20/alpha crystallin family protein [Lacinutrix sp. C3R15]MDO6623079.1 Hsp20/alpha crystallin family protein [Oceanihabitans sp. 1_MG-2023]